MKFTLDRHDILSFILCSDDQGAALVAQTPEWKNNEELDMKISVNGIPIKTEALDEVLKEMWEQAQVESGMKEFERRVKEAASELIKEKFCDIHNKMYDFENALDYALDED